METRNRITSILFDLDGTLTDPAEGITGYMGYALEGLSLPARERAELASYIGPPLRETFATLCRTSDSALIERAITLYRERFSTIGLYENELYPGITEMLDALQQSGHRLFVATSKPQIFAEKVLEHFSLARYFTAVHGSELAGGRLDDKAVLVGELVGTHRLNPAETAMVGDRKYDILAARASSLRSVGVTYGYGSREELLEEGADHLADSPSDVGAIFR